MEQDHFNNIDLIGVSVVLCCHNGKDRIKPTLEHLSRQKDVDFPWEILLVDNNSSDNTSVIAVSYWRDLPGPIDLRVIYEPRPGTMCARKAGIVGCSFRYLLFCDDDNWLEELYLRKAFDLIIQDPEIAAVGGHGIVKTEHDAPVPSWVENYRSSFGTGPQGTRDGDTTEDKGCLYTAGAIIDRVWLDKLYNQYGFESSLKGRDGKSLVAGEDTELTFALKLIGAKLHYSSQLRFFHYMPGPRLNWQYFRKLNISLGRSSFLLSPYRLHFHEQTRKSIVAILANKIYIFIRLYFRAYFYLLQEGNINIMRYERAKGEMLEAFTNMKTFLANDKVVTTLSNKLKKVEIAEVE